MSSVPLDFDDVTSLDFIVCKKRELDPFTTVFSPPKPSFCLIFIYGSYRLHNNIWKSYRVNLQDHIVLQSLHCYTYDAGAAVSHNISAQGDFWICNDDMALKTKIFLTRPYAAVYINLGAWYLQMANSCDWGESGLRSFSGSTRAYCELDTKVDSGRKGHTM